MKLTVAVLLGLLLLGGNCDGQSHTDGLVVVGVFVGSTPNNETISRRLNTPTHIEPPVHWELTLYRDAKNQSPTSYKLRCDYAASTNVGKQSQIERTGLCKLTKGTKFKPNATVLELDGLVSLFKVDENLLHFLDAEGGLMVGDGGFSFTLNRTTAAESPQQPPPANAPSVSYKLSPQSTGPTVYGVFEGRTPCMGIARELGITLDAHRMKCKWRVTLLQNPETKSPTTYKVEGSFYRGDLREGNWSIVRGPDTDSLATVYRLEPARGENALLLLKGDDNVLFFADQKSKPLVGHAEFSYTLNRKFASEAVGQSAQAK